MKILDFIYDLQTRYLPSPDLNLDANKTATFERIYDSALYKGANRPIEYDSEFSKYEFLSYLIQYKNVLMHGSNEMNMDVLKPIRKSTDMRECGNLKAVYACSDGIWPIFFAILNRSYHSGSTSNDCFWARDDTGARRKYYYFFIDTGWIRNNPWTNGMVYISDRNSFKQLLDIAGNPLEEWVSLEPAPILARLPVVPSDFPFLNRVRALNPSFLDKARTDGHKAAQSVNSQMEVDPKIYDAYLGKYEILPDFVVNIKKKKNRLFVQASRYPEIEIYPESESVYFFKIFEVKITFMKNADGKVTHLLLCLEDEVLPAKKIQEDAMRTV